MQELSLNKLNAMDAVQTTLVKVWKNIAMFDPEKGTIEAGVLPEN
jgi:DNA-directed RNA polymerase specialized sigma24 family protein